MRVTHSSAETFGPSSFTIQWSLFSSGGCQAVWSMAKVSFCTSSPCYLSCSLPALNSLQGPLFPSLHRASSCALSMPRTIFPFPAVCLSLPYLPFSFKCYRLWEIFKHLHTHRGSSFKPAGLLRSLCMICKAMFLWSHGECLSLPLDCQVPRAGTVSFSSFHPSTQSRAWLRLEAWLNMCGTNAELSGSSGTRLHPDLLFSGSADQIPIYPPRMYFPHSICMWIHC